MLACIKCGKGKNTLSYSRHKKGSSGAGGTWALRAPIHVRTQYPNLHIYKGQKYCTKCLRAVKKPYVVHPANGGKPAEVQAVTV